MADNINNNGSNTTPPVADNYTTGQYTQPNQTSPFTTSDEVMYLKSMDSTLKAILQNCRTTSASNARNAAPTREEVFRDRYNQTNRRRNRSYDPIDDIFGRRTRGRSSKDSFMDAFEQELWDAVIGSDFKKGINQALNGLANMMGVEIEDIPKTLGKELGKTVVGAVKGTKVGQEAFAKFEEFKQRSIESLKDAFMSGVEDVDAANGTNYAEKFRQGAATAQPPVSGSTDEVVSNVANKSVSDVQNISTDSIHITATTVTISAAKILEEGANSEEAIDDASKSAETAQQLGSDSSELAKSAPATQPPEASDNTQSIQNAVSDASTDLAQNFNGVLDNFKGQFSKSVSNFMNSGLGQKLGGTKIGKAAQMITSKGSAVAQKFGGQIAAKGGAAAAKGSTAMVAKGGSALATSGTAAAGSAAAGTAATGTAATGAAAALKGVASVASKLGPYGWIIVGVIVAITKTIKALGPAVEGTKELFNELDRVGKRDRESRKKNIEYAQKRLTEDVETLITEPFEIMKDAAQKAYDVWDSNLKMISATQGYTKADTQDLWAGYSARLRAEGLTDVVSSADIMESLSKVIDSGLSGKIGEEFAYRATILNNAIPTEDFFNYADTYGSIYANAIKDGASHSAAIQLANAELETFASNVLYASRSLTNGVNTGLQNADKLFEYSTQIARTARTNNAAQLSSVLTSVSAVAGAIAPNVADSIVDAVVKSAIGGNSSEIVALRSIAGINASNTEFLKSFASNPQKIFATLFDNLATMQQGGAFMERAEGLADTFGLSMEALSQVDFSYLANAISTMNVSNASLSENMKHLQSGETTTTAEQLRMRQINQYMIDEGLAYVLDNQAARAIQDHMWEEQIARELMEAEYGVELKGKALNFLEGIRQTIDNILDFLNPFSWLKKAANMIATAAESNALESDIRQVLELGKVGAGNSAAMYALTTRNKDLQLTKSLVSQLGGVSAYESAANMRQLTNLFTNSLLYTPGRVMSEAVDMFSPVAASLSQTLSTLNSGMPDIYSKYRWGSVSKSMYDAVFNSATLSNGTLAAPVNYTSLMDNSVSTVVDKIQQMVGTIEEYATSDKGLTYDDWAATAKNYNIVDLSAAIAEAGYSETEIRGQFEAAEAKAGQALAQADRELENNFHTEGRQYFIDELAATNTIIANQERFWSDWDTNFTAIELPAYIKAITDRQDKFWNDWNDNFTASELPSYIASIITNQRDIYNDWQKLFLSDWTKFHSEFTDYVGDWTDYFINHTAYNASGYSYDKVAEIQQKEKDGAGDAVRKLAEALTQNAVDLKDPAVQTNALLAQILIVAEAIMQQNNGTGLGLSLSDTITGLSMGIVNRTE